MSDPRQTINTIIFDLGGVLIDWNPEYLYRQLIPDPVERRHFLSAICSPEWNHQVDAGASMPDAVSRLASEHPQHDRLIRAWWDRWPEMLGGEVPGTRAVAEALAADGVRLYGLTNWSADTWPRGLELFPFLTNLFDGVVVSGVEGVAKPDQAVFEILQQRYGVDPIATGYVDDSPTNLETAAQLGYRTHLFESAAALERWLTTLGLLPRR